VSTGPRQPLLSVCIVNWNAGDVLFKCLAALAADRDRGRWEILVIDNASPDGSAAAIARRYPDVRVELNPQNLGFAAASNRALDLARGTYLLLLNPDTRVRPGALGGLVDLLDQQPDVGAVGPRLVGDDGALQLSCGRTPSLWTAAVAKLLLHRLFSVYKFGRREHAKSRDVGWVSGACLMARRQAVQAAGRLDPAIFMFHEDVEWCMRIRRAGWRIVYSPGSEVVHLGGQSVRQDLGRMLVASQRSQFYLFHKHFGLWSVRVLRWLTVAEMLLRAAAWTVLTLLCPGRRAEGRERLRAYRQIIASVLTDRSYWAPLQCRQDHAHT
jgi:GT2 family glycosyltransferase